MKYNKEDRISRLMNDMRKTKIRCNHCGHMVIVFKTDKALCDYCGYYVFSTPKEEFKYRMKERLRRVK